MHRKNNLLFTTSKQLNFLTCIVSARTFSFRVLSFSAGIELYLKTITVSIESSPICNSLLPFIHIFQILCTFWTDPTTALQAMSMVVSGQNAIQIHHCVSSKVGSRSFETPSEMKFGDPSPNFLKHR